MTEIGSLKEKVMIVQDIAKKLYPFDMVIFLVGPNQVLDFETKRKIRSIGVEKCVSVLFFDSRLEAESGQINMTANLEVYKKCLMEISGGNSGNRKKVLKIVNHCLDVLNRAEFMKIDF